MEEQGGYSGPQLFPNTVNLVKRYRRILDYPLRGQNEWQQKQLPSQEPVGTKTEATMKRDEENLQQSSTSEVSKPAKLTPKVIFCTGGIENGQQALEVLNAGASVAQIYSKLDFINHWGESLLTLWYSSSCLRRCGEDYLYEARDEGHHTKVTRIRCA